MDVPRAARRIIVQAPADPAKWPKPHPNTESPRLATFAGVLHWDPRRKQSLTAVTSWRTRLASDGLAIPGTRASRYDLYDDTGDDELEHRWREALPEERLQHRFVYGLYGVSPEHGWWAVLYRRRDQLDSLMSLGTTLTGEGAVTWPATSVGLNHSALQRLWPALTRGQLTGTSLSRFVAEPILHTPTALVHRLLTLGVAPVTMMTSNLALLDRRVSTFDGVPWFAFRADDRQGAVIAEVTAAGQVRRLHQLGSGFGLVAERCWGVTAAVARRLRLHGIRLPASLDGITQSSMALSRAVDGLGRYSELVVVPSPSIEDLLSSGATEPSSVEMPRGAQVAVLAAWEGQDGEVVGRLPRSSGLLVKPANLSLNREGDDAVAVDNEPAERTAVLRRSF